MPKLISKDYIDGGIVCDDSGSIVHNSFQQDDPIVKEKYDDGTIHLKSSRTGKLIVAPYNPKEYEDRKARCPHCDGVLG